MKNTSTKKASMEDLISFLNLFQGREEVFARQWGDGQGYSPVRPERSLNADDIALHIRGAGTYGIYLIKKDSTVKLVCFDIDLPKNLAEMEEDALVTDKSSLLPQVKSIFAAAVDVLHYHSFDSGGMLIEDTGGRGYHVWFFFESPIPAANARKFAYSILKKAKVQCEVFPKQDEVSAGQYGNLIKLPIGLHKKYKRYSKFLDMTKGRVSAIEDPFAHLNEIVPIPISMIIGITHETLKQKEQEPTRPKENRAPARVLAGKATGEVLKNPRTGDLFEKCRAFSNLKKKTVGKHHLAHVERLALAYVMINTEDGEEVLHQMMSNCSDYNRDRTQKEMDYLKARGMKPISCQKLIEQGICNKFCRSEIQEQFRDPNRPEPSPIRFALWRDASEPEFIWETDTLGFENVYKKSNLYRSWEQIKDYVRANEAFFDIHALEDFEEHLEENVETLRFELRNHTYSLAPYRWYSVPKERKGNSFKYRRMAFVHPRDYIVIQAIINIIGPIFERSFSTKSCLGYRLDTEGKTGNSIFYGWQSAWQNRKKRVTSFLHHPECFCYIKADISKFFDTIDRVRLYGLILEKVGSAAEICETIKKFLENSYIDDSNGKEKRCSPPSKGIPQGPAFSAFFANIYLNELDHLIEKKSFDYARYVDDMVILCTSKDEAGSIKKWLDNYLPSVNLQLNEDKTTGPCPVTNSEHILDFLGEMKYGMAGLFARHSYAEQLMSAEFLKAELDDLFKIRELNIYDLEEIANHLSYYLRMHERIAKLDDLAKGLSKKVLEEYPLKPHHLAIVLEVLIRNEVDLSIVISRCRYPYAKIVLCIVLANLEETPPWAESFLIDSIKDGSSYILRGTAYSTLPKLNRENYQNVLLDIIPKEESSYAIGRSLDCLVRMQSDEAKMCFLKLAERCFEACLNEMVNATIEWGDPMLDKLIKNRIGKINRVNTSDLYIILEFIFILCPDDFGELLLRFFSEDETALMHQLLFSSMDEIRKMAAKRGYLEFAHQSTIYDKMKSLESGWLRSTLLDAIEEWRIGTAELSPATTLKDINYWLTNGDASREPQKVENLSSKEHLRRGGYQSWLVKDKKTNENFVLEGVEEDVLKEHELIGNGIASEDIKEQLESNKLSTLSDCFHNVEGGKKYYWFKYMIPEGYNILRKVYNEQGTEARFDEQEVLNMVSSLFSQVQRIKQHIGVEPVVNPCTVILGEGNQVRLINIFFGTPRKLYVSAHDNSIADTSTTTNALFNGLLSYELISSKCPIGIYRGIQSKPEQARQLMSDYLPDATVSLHFAWILDRLCYLNSPQNRYNSLNTLRRDIERFRRFKNHFQDKKLADLPPDKKYCSEVLDVLNLRVARFLKLPYKERDSLHENAIEVFGRTVHCVSKALASSLNNVSSNFNWGSKSLILKSSVSNHLHEAGHKCDLFVGGIRNTSLSISKITKWPIVPTVPLIILYIPLKLELIALARAVGLFEMHKRDEIRDAVVRFLRPEHLSNEGVGEMPLDKFSTTSFATKVGGLMDLFTNKRFQDVINTDGSDIVRLMLAILTILEEDRELWVKWCTHMGLCEKNNLSRAVNHLEYITESSEEIERLTVRLMNDPLAERFQDGNDLVALYNSCLQSIARFRKTMRISRKRALVKRTFNSRFENVVIKLAHKEIQLSQDLIISFPPYYKIAWEKEGITVDSVSSGKNNKITSLSLIPTGLKSIKDIGWKYENLLRKCWNWMKIYSRKFLWRIIAVALFLLGVVLSYLEKGVIGTIFLVIASWLIGPWIAELFSKKHEREDIKEWSRF